MGTTLDLAQLISSSCRQKIIETLSKVKQTHIMDLVRRINSTYGQVNRNVQILEQEGIVNSNYHGRMRMIKLNSDNPKTVAILKALRILKNQESYK
jgi:predicted transcriptional regulator